MGWTCQLTGSNVRNLHAQFLNVFNCLHSSKSFVFNAFQASGFQEDNVMTTATVRDLREIYYLIGANSR